jgi:hypothetical protein
MFKRVIILVFLFISASGGTVKAAKPILPPFPAHDMDVLFWKNYNDMINGSLLMGFLSSKIEYYGNTLNMSLFTDVNNDQFRHIMGAGERDSFLSHFSLLLGVHLVSFINPHTEEYKNDSGAIELNTPELVNPDYNSEDDADDLYGAGVTAIGIHFKHFNLRIGNLMQGYWFTKHLYHVYEQDGQKYKYYEERDLPYDESYVSNKAFIDTDIKILNNFLVRALYSGFNIGTAENRLFMLAPIYIFGKRFSFINSGEYFINPYVIITDDARSRRDFGMAQLGIRYKHHLGYRLSFGTGMDNFVLFEINNTFQHKGEGKENIASSLGEMDNTYAKVTVCYFIFAAGIWTSENGTGVSGGLRLGEYFKLMFKYNEYSSLPLSKRGDKQKWLGFEFSMPGNF